MPMIAGGFCYLSIKKCCFGSFVETTDAVIFSLEESLGEGSEILLNIEPKYGMFFTLTVFFICTDSAGNNKFVNVLPDLT